LEAYIVQDLRSKLDIAAEALRRAEERALAGQFALEVMHEIRNSVEAVGYLIHLANQEENPTVIHQHLREAHEQMAPSIRLWRKRSVSLDCCQWHSKWT
jgi:hypothetical protein